MSRCHRDLRGRERALRFWVVVRTWMSLSIVGRVGRIGESESTRDQTIFVGLPLEFFAEIGMSNADDRLSAFRYGFALKVDHAVLRDDIHRVRAWRGDDVAWGQARYDATAALAAFLVRRGETNEGFTTR